MELTLDEILLTALIKLHRTNFLAKTLAQIPGIRRSEMEDLTAEGQKHTIGVFSIMLLYIYMY